MRRFVAAIVAGWATATAGLSTAQAEEKEKPAVVCESDASGRAMICRDAWPGEDAAPFRRVAPNAPSRTGAAPKPSQPLLATPSPRTPQATPPPDYLRSERQVAARPATVAPSADMESKSAQVSSPAATSVTGGIPALSTTTTATPLPEPTSAPAERPMPAAAPTAVVVSADRELPAPSKPAALEAVTAPRAEPVMTARESQAGATAAAAARSASAPAPKPLAEPMPTIEPAPELAKAASPADTAPPAVEPTVQPEPVAAVPAAAELFGSREFAALDGRRYTLELANATSAAPLRALAARLRLDGALYLIHLRNPDADRWLLTWSDHASQAEARAARLLVPADAGINSAWPRRLAPLQSELVSP